MLFIRLGPLLETAETVPVQHGRKCLHLISIVRRTEIRQALERDGQLDLGLRILMSHPRHL
jgi:hypothetical protein